MSHKLFYMQLKIKNSNKKIISAVIFFPAVTSKQPTLIYKLHTTIAEIKEYILMEISSYFSEVKYHFRILSNYKFIGFQFYAQISILSADSYHIHFVNIYAYITSSKEKSFYPCQQFKKNLLKFLTL